MQKIGPAPGVSLAHKGNTGHFLSKGPPCGKFEKIQVPRSREGTRNLYKELQGTSRHLSAILGQDERNRYDRKDNASAFSVGFRTC